MEDARDASATGMRVLFFEGNGDAGLVLPHSCDVESRRRKARGLQ